MKPIKIINDILNIPWKKGICPRCGDIQTHTRIYCSCGKQYKIFPKTILDAMKISVNNDYGNKTQLRPQFQYAIYKRKLKPIGITEKQFINYCENCMNRR